MVTSIADIKARLIQLGIAREDEFYPCSEAQIEEIMQSQDVRSLPAIYLDFLKIMGQGAGKGEYLSGHSEFFYAEVMDMKNRATAELTQEHSPLHLPQSAFVFFTHNQGYQFLFFETGGDSIDPGYFEYLDGRTEFIRHETLLSFYQRSLQWLEEKPQRHMRK